MRDKREITIVLVSYLLIVIMILLTAYIIDERTEAEKITETLTVIENTPTPSPSPTVTSTPTPSPSPTPAGEITHQQFYNECVNRGLVTPANEEGNRISKEVGGYYGPSGRETYYNLKMDLCVYYMRQLGYDEIVYPYWIRDDGAKMLGNYVMCAANWNIRPKGTIIPTSLGDAIVVDTGDFIVDYPNGVDLAVDW